MGVMRLMVKGLEILFLNYLTCEIQFLVKVDLILKDLGLGVDIYCIGNLLIFNSIFKMDKKNKATISHINFNSHRY